MTDAILEALLVILGTENEWWVSALVDAVEWTDPKYFHQN